MKIRAGFVSNSSSSSFVIVAKKDKHDALLAELPEFDKAVIKEYFSTWNGSETTVFGTDCIVYTGYQCDGESNFDDLDIEIPEDKKTDGMEEWEYGEVRKNAFMEFIASMDDDDVFQHHTDC